MLDAFFGDLFGWGAVLGFTGLVVAAAATSLDPEQLENPTARLRERITRRPKTTAGRVGRALLAIVSGLVIAFSPELALNLAALLVGGYLVFFGAAELLAMLQSPDAKGKVRAEDRRRRSFAVAAAAGMTVVVAIAISLLVILDSAEDPEAKPLPRTGCNGSVALCDLRLNEAIFAGTHNSFSAADSPGWLIANQRRNIHRQLDDGIRLFLIDTHWGVEGADGRVRTDFESEGTDRNKVVKALPPATLAAAERVAGRVGLRENEPGERDIWLCHTTCELGATDFSDTLEVYAASWSGTPGEVVILFVEPYVPPPELEQAFKDAGLDEYVETLELGEPMPTLGAARAQRPPSARLQRAGRGRPALVHGRLRVHPGHAAGGHRLRPAHLRPEPRVTREPAPDAQPLGRRLPAPADPQRRVPDPGQPAEADRPVPARARPAGQPDRGGPRRRR